MQKEHQGSYLARKFFQHAQHQELRLLLKILLGLNFTQLLGFNSTQPIVQQLELSKHFATRHCLCLKFTEVEGKIRQVNLRNSEGCKVQSV